MGQQPQVEASDLRVNKLWINDVRVNGYRVVCHDEAGKPFTYRYFTTMNNSGAEAQANALCKDLRKDKIIGVVEPAKIVLGNIDGLDKDTGSLRVSLDLFVDANGDAVNPETHQLFNFSHKDIYFNVDEDDNQVGDYLSADTFEVGTMEDTKKSKRVSIFG
jgi:hypothetical protein